FGIPADQFAGFRRDFYSYVHPDDRRQVSEEVSRSRDHQKPYDGEFRVIRQDGAVHWGSARGEFQYTKAGQPQRMLGMAVDITERKLAEEALKKSEEKFSKAFRQSPLALALVVASDHRFLDINEAFERYSGWKRAEIIGQTPIDLDLWVDPQQRVEFV